jgi:uncharacterized membrane protein
MSLLAILIILGNLEFVIDPKDADNIMFLLSIVGVASIFGMVMLIYDDSGRLKAIVPAILIAVVAYTLIFTGFILADKPASEEEITERTITEKTKTVAEKTVTWLDASMILLGVSLIIALVIACLYVALTGF